MHRCHCCFGLLFLRSPSHFASGSPEENHRSQEQIRHCYRLVFRYCQTWSSCQRHHPWCKMKTWCNVSLRMSQSTYLLRLVTGHFFVLRRSSTSGKRFGHFIHHRTDPADTRTFSLTAADCSIGATIAATAAAAAFGWLLGKVRPIVTIPFRLANQLKNYFSYLVASF